MSEKNIKSTLSPEQWEIFENAQKRVKEKRGLYAHGIALLIGSFILVILNLILGYGMDFRPLDYPWSLWILFIWIVIWLYHAWKVFVIHKFFGKSWEKKQMKTLVNKQIKTQEKIENKQKNDSLLMEKESFDALPDTNENPGLTLIVAVSENGVIGKDNELLWHLSDDLKHFKKLTGGHHVIMGRKTYESMPKALPQRTNIVITRQKNYKASDALVVSSLTKALEIAKDDAQPFVIGGGEIYGLALEKAQRIELTRVHHTFEGDTHFPSFDMEKWQEVSKEYHTQDAQHPYAFTFIRYVRKA